MGKITFILFLFLFTYMLSTKSQIDTQKNDDQELSIITYQNGEWEVKSVTSFEKEDYVAAAIYIPSLEAKGWDQLAIKTNKMYNDFLQAEGAGRLEGNVTQLRIKNHYTNVYSINHDLKDTEREFFTKQEEFIVNSFKEHPEDPVIYNAYLLYLQYKGIRDQYNLIAEEKIPDHQFHLMAAFGDFFEIHQKFGERPDFEHMTYEELEDYIFMNSHCSALWKAKEDLSDVFFGHNSWYLYPMMTRIFKEYNLNFNHYSVKAKTVMFSSYAATLSSNDDFYVSGKDIAVIETTNELFNNDLLDLIKPESLLTWQRVQIANRMAETSKEWTEIFAKYNSGTYNNMYMALDMKKIDLEKHLIMDGAMHIIDQVPGTYAINDVTEHLRYGYWPSYNTPYDQGIIKISKIKEQIERVPSIKYIADYDMCNRAAIFRRDQSKVKNIEDFQKIMNYNNYKEDELTRHDPANTIAARGDLRERKSCNGAYDAKATSVSEAKGKHKTIRLFGGPSHLDVEPFSWESAGSACEKFSHVGLNNEYSMEWFKITNLFEIE